MKLVFLDLLLAHKLINDIDSDIQTLWSQSEFPMNINNPLNQKGPRGVFDFCLDFLEVIWIDHVLDLVF